MRKYAKPSAARAFAVSNLDFDELALFLYNEDFSLKAAWHVPKAFFSEKAKGRWLPTSALEDLADPRIKRLPIAQKRGQA